MLIDGYPMSTLQNEKDFYTSQGWSWNPVIEPNYPVDNAYDVTPLSIDIHGDPEGDDLWMYLMMYERTSQAGFLSRATAWKDYWLATTSSDPLYGNDLAFGAEHLCGWGLLAWYNRSINLGSADTPVLNKAIQIAEDIAYKYGPNTDFNAALTHGGLSYGLRMPGRHVLLLERLVEVAGNISLHNDNSTGTVAVQTLLDSIIDRILASAHWNSVYGMFFIGNGDGTANANAAYASGVRTTPSYQCPNFVDGLYRYYLANKGSANSTMITRCADIRSKLISIAHFVYTYGLDPTYQYTSSWYGVNINDGTSWQEYNAGGAVNEWDTNYTASLVLPLVIGYKLSGTAAWLAQAKYVYGRHNGAIGDFSPTGAFDPNNRHTLLHHFVDTCANSSLNQNSYTAQFMEYEKGELQKTYMLFENGGAPTVESNASRLVMVTR